MMPTRIPAEPLSLLIVTFQSLPNVIGAMKSRRMRVAGHLARTGGRELHAVFWWRNLKEKYHLQDCGVDGVSYISRVGRAGLYSCDRGEEHLAKYFKHSDELQVLGVFSAN
jgi:hypothetical protein